MTPEETENGRHQEMTDEEENQEVVDEETEQEVADEKDDEEVTAEEADHDEMGEEAEQQMEGDEAEHDMTEDETETEAAGDGTGEGLSEEEIADMTEDVEAPGESQSAESVNPVEFQEASESSGDQNFTLELLMDVELPVRVELGRTTMSVDELLEFGPGSVVELDKMAGEPAELYIRDTFFARGEVVVVDNNFGLRITDLTERAREIGAESPLSN